MRDHLFNDSRQRDRRRELRNKPTTPEWILWQDLKKSQLGWKFRRQQGIGPYIVDFYCPKLKLVIEVDGDIHAAPEAILYDQDRTNFFSENGILVLRIKNTDIMDSPSVVIEVICKKCKEISGSPPF